LRLWDLQGNEIGQPFEGHQAPVYKVAFSPNGEWIVSGGVDGTIRLWSGDGVQLASSTAPHAGYAVTSLVALDDSLIGASRYDIFMLAVETPTRVQGLSNLSRLLQPDSTRFGETLETITNYFERTETVPDSSLSEAGAQFLDALKELRSRWFELERQKAEAETSAIQDGRNTTSALEDKAWLSLNITRIGTIIIVLFLVQVFITMYRYNTRLSAFYRARAHALKLYLWGFDHTEDFSRLVENFTPYAVDFAKGPTSPSEQIVKAVNNIVSSAGKGSK